MRPQDSGQGQGIDTEMTFEQGVCLCQKIGTLSLGGLNLGTAPIGVER